MTAVPALPLALVSFLGVPRRQPDLEAAWQRFAGGIQPPYASDAVLLAALDALAELVPGDGYYAYTARQPGQPLQLRVTRTATGIPTVGPNYAGLVTGAAPRAAPLELPVPDSPGAARWDGTAAEPFLTLASGQQVLLRVAVRSAERNRLRRLLEPAALLAGRLRPSLELLLHAEATALRVEEGDVRSTAQQAALELALRVDRALGLLCRMGTQALVARDGFLAVWQERQTFELLWTEGDGAGLAQALDPRVVHARLDPLQVAGWQAPRLPRALLQRGLQSYSFIPLDPGGGKQGALVYGGDAAPPSEQPRIAASLSRALTAVLREGGLARRLAQGFLDTLLISCELLDTCDPLNSRHSQQVAELCRDLAGELGWSAPDVAAAELAGRLHDLGMIAVELSLPQKPGTLSETEREVVRQHPGIGADLLAGLPPEILPPDVETGVRYHHERWDGWGYPEGLSGKDIPAMGRLVACAENLVARLSSRSYRRGLSLPRALGQLATLAGNQLDPEMVAALLRLYALRHIEPEIPES